ncbi:MAG TPA: peptide ABC transporter substrate-binding protein [Candidatus Limnocylindrales bacterium]|nr:peptide ABC transporter substrate-binding protein [Candidatus Limnocylindrales bacterium]
MAPGLTPPGDEPPVLEREVPPSGRRRLLAGALALLVVGALVAQGWPAGEPGRVAPVAAADPETVTILAGTPASIDPAKHGDLGSATYVSQLFETLTAVDPTLTVRPALAESWTVEDGGTRVVFTLREGLAFSDGSALTASDVVRSWRRLFDPREPSPLASLIADVKGARELLTGQSSDPATLGVTADGERRVVVELERGGSDLPAIVSGAPFGVVPRSAGDGEILPTGGDFVGSGGYLLKEVTEDAFVLEANPRYWAGEPAIRTVRMLTTLDGRSPVDAFVAGDVDHTALGYIDAGWIAYDRELGPLLRSDPSLSVTYYGFDTRRAPFDDPLVRRAFAQAVDWRRLAALDELGSSVPATGMVPAGIPGRPEGDYIPPYDPEGARELLRQAGFADGAALGPIPFIASGGGYDGAIIAMLEENLGVDIDYATMDFGSYQDRLATDPPAIWSISWVADYPGSNDFLGVLLGTGSTANEGGWSNADFDAAIAEAGAATSQEAATEAYARASEIVRDEAPAVPVTYGTSYSLVRDGLLGATENGLGILRLAGLAWEE